MDWKKVESFYLDASVNTYAADAPKTTITELPRSKVLRYELGELTYVDLWFSYEIHSFGQTIIWRGGIPIWGMQYHGSVLDQDSRILPFLKRALKEAYMRREFLGGRGPLNYAELPLKYRNRPHPSSTFLRFSGEEQILNVDMGHKPVFFHKYRGIALRDRA